jgi:stringent starvation protein B
MANRIKTSMEIFLIRAVIDWAVSSKLTPLIAVRLDCSKNNPLDWIFPLGVPVTDPVLLAGDMQRRKDTIIFNVHPKCVRDFLLYDGTLSFLTVVNGVTYSIRCPITEMRAVYTRENGLGVSLNRASAAVGPALYAGLDAPPRLRIVK